MTLDVAIRHRIGAIALDVDLRIGAGLTAVVGHSGSGKTTMLNAIAGVIRPDTGRIALGDQVFADVARGIWLPPHARRVGYVFQEPRLFPHLSVRGNLGFGRWFARRRAANASIGTTASMDDVIELCGLGPLLARRPTQLSGGEKQRVALGRALLSSPQLLLLDEPLASIDVDRRAELLPYLDRLRAELRVPMLYVTHTLSEVETRADRIVSLSEGRVRSGA